MNGNDMKKKSIFAVTLLIFLGLGVCAVMGIVGLITTTNLRATASPTLVVLQSTLIETPLAQRISPSLTPLPGQVGVLSTRTASSLTRTAYPTDIAFYTTTAPTKPVVLNEGTATKFFLTPGPLMTLDMSHPSGTTGLCRDGRYTSLQIKQDACHYDGGIYSWWGPTPVK
jgi:hypothetical protein